MTRTKKIMMIGLLLALTASSCEKHPRPPEDLPAIIEAAAEEERETQMETTTRAPGADLSPDAPAFDETAAVTVSPEEWITALDGKNGVYTAPPGVYKLTAPLVFGEQFNGSAIDCGGTVFFSVDMETTVSVEADNFILQGLTVSAACPTGITVFGKNITIKNCVIAGSLSSAVLTSGGANITVESCLIDCPGSALSDQSDGYVTFTNNIVSGCENPAVMIRSPYGTVMYNTVGGGDVSIAVSGENVYNILAAKNKTEGGIEFSGCDNSVILGNVIGKGSITAASCYDLTVALNTLGQNTTIVLTGVTAPLVTENKTSDGTDPDIRLSDCESAVGGNIPGMLAGTVYTGADLSLLPPVRLDRFEKSAARNMFSYNGRTVTADHYINGLIAQGGEVIIPPGKYALASTVLLENIQNLDIHAYGVFFVFEDSSKMAVAMLNSGGIAIRGLTVDFVSVPNAQGTVLSAGDGKVVWKPDEGYDFDLCDRSRFAENAAAEGFKKGSMIPFCDLYNINMNTTKNTDGTFTLETTARFLPGDKITFRGVFAHVIYAQGCSDVFLEDITLWGGSGFGFCEVNGEGNTKLNRVLMTPGPKPEGAVEERMLSVCDATHCTNMRKGIEVTYSRFEYMTDDGTNVNGTYGLIDSYDETTRTVTYNASTTPEIRAGDRIWIMTLEGSLLADTTAVSSGQNGKVVLADVFDVPAGEGIFIENVSANGAGFRFENVLIRGNRSRGLVIKSTNGVVSHCTVESTGMTGILLKPEISDNWGECGFCENITLEYNKITGTGHFDPGSDAQSAIAVRTDLAAINESYFSHRNITISGNEIDAYYGGFAVCLRGVSGATVKDNIIGSRHSDINARYPKDEMSPLYLSGCADIEMDGNVFSGEPASVMKTNGKTINIFGDDVR